jgi:hypothetical protein
MATATRGNIHRSVAGSLCPRKIVSPLKMMSHLSSLNVTVQPALQSGRMPINDATARCRTMCPVKLVGRPGIFISHSCVECTLLPSGKRIVNGCKATLLFLTSTPSITKMDVAPVSAIAWDVAIVIALRCSAVAFPKIVRAVDATIDVRRRVRAVTGLWCKQVEVKIVLSLSAMLKQKILGSKEEVVVAETKWLHSFAPHTFPSFAPNRQACVGSIVLCIPFVQAPHPCASFCCA